ncbi:hypothetical protein G6L28_22605 [Agrobacterium larrymoorei]|uniref:hypothetical protein n=1 Tax=Agrobacterium larrymoorei TaxID=160699 RepID=UPI001574BB21|nr:hypothetical protein [Agrobacterium larrymoorei]NTJ45360.1 hypothetical protein [Agrobacterium larrymoorei]
MNIISTSVRFGTDVDQKLKNSDANSIASLLSQFTLTKETNGKRYEREFERQELATLHSSIASQLALSGELDGALKAFEVALSAKADFESSNASARSSKKRIAYVSSVEHQPRLTVRIPETCISIVKEVEVRFEELANVLESNDVGLEAKERSLDRCFLTYGAMVPLVYTLGGQLKMLGMTESSHNTQANEVKAADNAEGDLNAGKGPVSISIATKTSTDAISRTDRETKSEQSDYSHEANGGDATLVGDPNKWIKSLDDPAKLVVIEYDDLLPIWNFFSAPLKQRFEKQKALIQNIYETKIERYNAKTAALGAILHENKTLESRTKFPLPNNTDVTSINLAPKYKLGEKIHYGVQGVEGAISQQGKLEADFSIWNQLLPSDNATFFAHDGNIFTYISLSTSFDPPSAIETPKPFLLTNKFFVHSTQFNQPHGLAWGVTVEEAPISNVFPTKNYIGDLAFLRTISKL